MIVDIPLPQISSFGQLNPSLMPKPSPAESANVMKEVLAAVQRRRALIVSIVNGQPLFSFYYCFGTILCPAARIGPRFAKALLSTPENVASKSDGVTYRQRFSVEIAQPLGILDLAGEDGLIARMKLVRDWVLNNYEPVKSANKDPLKDPLTDGKATPKLKSLYNWDHSDLNGVFAIWDNAADQPFQDSMSISTEIRYVRKVAKTLTTLAASPQGRQLVACVASNGGAGTEPLIVLDSRPYIEDGLLNTHARRLGFLVCLSNLDGDPVLTPCPLARVAFESWISDTSLYIVDAKAITLEQALTWAPTPANVGALRAIPAFVAFAHELSHVAFAWRGDVTSEVVGAAILAETLLSNVSNDILVGFLKSFGNIITDALLANFDGGFYGVDSILISRLAKIKGALQLGSNNDFIGLAKDMNSAPGGGALLLDFISEALTNEILDELDKFAPERFGAPGSSDFWSKAGLPGLGEPDVEKRRTALREYIFAIWYYILTELYVTSAPSDCGLSENWIRAAYGLESRVGHLGFEKRLSAKGAMLHDNNCDAGDTGGGLQFPQITAGLQVSYLDLRCSEQAGAKLK